MKRRSFLRLGVATAASTLVGQLPALAFAGTSSGLKITDVRLIRTKPKIPQPARKGDCGLCVQVAGPMSPYAEYRARRDSYYPAAPEMNGFAVAVTTNKGVTGYGLGGPAGGYVVQNQLARLLIGEDPFNVERLWDIMWRATLHYGRTGVTMNAISGVDLALWDLIGKATELPVYKLLGGSPQARIPAYAHGPDIESYVKMGFKRIKLSASHGPATGRAGMKANVEAVKHARSLVGPDGEVMLDAWMGWTEPYTVQMAELLAPYRVLWIEEPLPPHDYDGCNRLRTRLSPMMIVSGEHEYGRYGFRQMLEHRSADVWNPDVCWAGGFTELRRVAGLAAAYDIPVMPHGGGRRCSMHFTQWVNSPYAEMYMPVAGAQYEAEYRLSRDAGGIYTSAPDEPGMGWDFVAEG